jgi:GNAT superfamily N-acetyltransferase
VARLLDWAEETVYRLNERDHWIFRLYDQGNEVWAALTLRAVRRRAAAIDQQVAAGEGAFATLRFLRPEDEEIFAELLGNFGSKYLPPHPLDRREARRALRRRSYMPFGIFLDGSMVGYVLLRLFFFRRVVTGIWTRPETHNVGLAQACLSVTVAFARREGIPNYCTIPVDNVNSVRVALGVGWRILRTNSRFHVLLVD